MCLHRPLLAPLLFVFLGVLFNSNALAVQGLPGDGPFGSRNGVARLDRSAPNAVHSTILSSWAPTIDGTIDPAEWAGATAMDITVVATPVILYVMNDADHLYLAVDSQGDLSLDPIDVLTFFFDDEGGVPPILGDGRWNTPTCPATDEGLYAIGNYSTIFPWDNLSEGISAAGECFPLVESTGSLGAYGIATGHMEYELRVDLDSHLDAQPGDTFGAFVSCTDGSFNIVGSTSSFTERLDPSTYVQLTLASPPTPAQSAWSLVVVAGLMGLAGMVAIRGRTRPGEGIR